MHFKSLSINRCKKPSVKALTKNTLSIFIAAIFLQVPICSSASILTNTFGEVDATGEINISEDQIGQLIQQRSLEYDNVTKILLENQLEDTSHIEHNYHHNHQDANEGQYSWGENYAFDNWYRNHYNNTRANQYKQYLEQRLGKNNVPPMSQLLLTARSWSSCGATKYEVPPNYLWNNMLPTLRLYSALKSRGVLPHNTIIRSVYRNPSLNRCASGSSGSKHLMNAAIDLWVPSFEYNRSSKITIQNRLCSFWSREGQYHNFGLGLYPTGSIHIDTQGHRKWGSNHSASSSVCRS